MTRLGNDTRLVLLIRNQFRMHILSQCQARQCRNTHTPSGRCPVLVDKVQREEEVEEDRLFGRSCL